METVLYYRGVFDFCFPSSSTESNDKRGYEGREQGVWGVATEQEGEAFWDYWLKESSFIFLTMLWKPHVAKVAEIWGMPHLVWKDPGSSCLFFFWRSCFSPLNLVRPCPLEDLVRQAISKFDRHPPSSIIIISLVSYHFPTAFFSTGWFGAHEQR